MKCEAEDVDIVMIAATDSLTRLHEACFVLGTLHDYYWQGREGKQ